MKNTQCKTCGKEINDKIIDIYYDNESCYMFCSKDCIIEHYIKEECMEKVKAENISQIDDCRFFYNGNVCESSLDDVCCDKCEKGSLIFSKIIEEYGVKSELYKCNKCEHEVIVECN